MTAISDYYENKILDHMVRAQAFTPPSTVYLGLFTSATTDAGGGTEVSGGAYARVAVTFGSAASGGIILNTAAITFPTATANWGTITHVALFDALSGGNMLFHGALASSRVINTNDVFEILTGNLSITLQ